MTDEYTRADQLIFEVRHPDKPVGYDAQKVAEELADLLEERTQEIESLRREVREHEYLRRRI